LAYLLAESIISYGTHSHGVKSKLRNVECEVGRRTAYLATLGKHIPQSFANAYDIILLRITHKISVLR
jgi:hypothetical protein